MRTANLLTVGLVIDPLNDIKLIGSGWPLTSDALKGTPVPPDNGTATEVTVRGELEEMDHAFELVSGWGVTVGPEMGKPVLCSEAFSVTGWLIKTIVGPSSLSLELEVKAQTLPRQIVIDETRLAGPKDIDPLLSAGKDDLLV